MNDLTILYPTANRLPDFFARNVRKQLLKAASGYPLISLTKKPLDFGINIVDAGEASITNYYKALLVGAKTATTPYIAVCEDDTLYNDEHFAAFRPPLDTFAYNFTRWNLYTWSDPPFFCLQQRKILATMIAPRQLFIEAIEERFAKHRNPPENWMGEPGRHQHEKALGVTRRNFIEFFTYNPLVVFSHPNSFGYQLNGKQKGATKVRALALPYWGTAAEVRQLYE